MHAAAQLTCMCAWPLIDVAARWWGTSSTVCTLNGLQQGQAWNAELRALSSLPPLLWSRSPACSSGALCQMPDEPLIREAVVPAAAKRERRATGAGGVTDRTGQSLCHPMALGGVLPPQGPQQTARWRLQEPRRVWSGMRIATQQPPWETWGITGWI